MTRRYIPIFILAILLRLATLGLPELTDPSEARFANAALRMTTTGDWITPSIYNSNKEWIPYLAKPPLHIWETAISFSLFGASPMAARIPSLLAIVVTAFLIGFFTRKIGDKDLSGGIWLALFSSLPTILLFCSASITDPSLMAAVTGVLVSFYLSFRVPQEKRWGFLFFIFAGIGTLIKGPVIFILTGLTITTFLLLERSIEPLKKLPWVRGIFIISLIACPWYYLAERANPGFLKYFFLQENFGRYFLKDFGNRFGSTHKRPFGTIWAYYFLALLPWSFTLIAVKSKTVRQQIVELFRDSQSFRFLICWALPPAIFFTFARQILPTYIFPSLPPTILLVAIAIHRLGWERRAVQICYGLLFFSIGVVLFAGPYVAQKSSAKEVSDFLRADLLSGTGEGRCSSLGALYKAPQSLLFYSHDMPLRITVAENEESLTKLPTPCILVSRHDFGRLKSAEYLNGLTRIKEFENWLLFKRDLSN